MEDFADERTLIYPDRRNRCSMPRSLHLRIAAHLVGILMKHNRNGCEDTVIKLTSARGLGRNILYRVSRAARAPDEIVRYEVPRNARGKKRRGRTRRPVERGREQWLHYKPPAKTWMATCSSYTDRASTRAHSTSVMRLDNTCSGRNRAREWEKGNSCF